MTFKATAHGDLSVTRGEMVEVLDQSKHPRLLVRNRQGGTGYVDSSLLSSERTPSPQQTHTPPKGMQQRAAIFTIATCILFTKCDLSYMLCV